MKQITSLVLLLFLSMHLSSARPGQDPVRLESPVYVRGIHCKDFVQYHPDGKISSCRLASAQVISGQTIPANTTIYFNEEGHVKYFFLSAPAKVGGYYCKGSGNNWMMTMFPNGKMKLIWLESDQVIQGVPCMAATIVRDVFGGGAGVSFHENGNLARCKVARDFTYKGFPVYKGRILRLDTNGNIIHE